MKSKSINYFLALLGFIPLAIWCYRYINYDLWYDEVYSLEEYALKDFFTTLFYYPSPNNHVFFNLTSQVISRFFGYRDIFSTEANVYVFRSFQLLISLGTAYFSVRILKRFFGCKSSFLLYVILFTTIPFMNFSLQLRGYNMSALFIVMLVYYSWSFLSSKKNFYLIMVLLSSLLLLYTIPSNLYALVAFWAILFSSWFYYFKKKDSVSIDYLKVLAFISAGAIVCFLLYLPILDSIVNNKYSNRGPFGLLYSFHVLRIASVDFFSNRFLLFALILPGIYLFYKKSSASEKYYFLSLAALFLIPFVLSFFHQKAPFPRVFVPLAPIFCMLITLLIGKVVDANMKSYKSSLLLIMVSGYCIVVFIVEMNKNDTIIAENMVDKNIETQDLYRNFYLASFYQQDNTMKILSDVYKGFPVVKLNQYDQPSTDLYLRKYNIPFTEIASVNAIPQIIEEYKRIYILTSFKKNTLAALKEIEGIEAKVLTPEYSFTNIIEVSATKD